MTDFEKEKLLLLLTFVICLSIQAFRFSLVFRGTDIGNYIESGVGLIFIKSRYTAAVHQIISQNETNYR